MEVIKIIMVGKFEFLMLLRVQVKIFLRFQRNHHLIKLFLFGNFELLLHFQVLFLCLLLIKQFKTN